MFSKININIQCGMGGKMEKPLISVIVPVYNVEQYLQRCLESIVNQTYSNLEIILVEDGSPDQCAIICDNWKEKDPRIKVIHQKNKGVSVARNVGVASAKGNLIGFVDADDMIHPLMYEEMMNHLVSQKCDLVMCGYTSFNDTTDYSQDINIYSKMVFERNEAIRYSFAKKEISKVNFINVVWSLLISADIAKSVEFDYSLTNGEDTKYAFDVLMKTKKVGFIDASLYYYYRNENGAVASLNSTKQVERIKVFRKIFLTASKIDDKNLKKEAYDFFIRQVACLIFLIDKKDLKKIRWIILENIKAILGSKDIYWKEKILIVLKLIC